MPKNSRREFLKTGALLGGAFVLPGAAATVMQLPENRGRVAAPKADKLRKPVSFVSDSSYVSPEEYLQKLQAISQQEAITPDFYGNGGATKALEEKFAQLLGKEQAIYLPTGTMANQVAMKLLNGNNTKVIVPENSHIFRDEADAAQSVHSLRLVPVGQGKPHFTKADLEETIKYLAAGEVFKSGLGTVVIENPVRRADGAFVPLADIQEIQKYCQEKGLKMHLDGARLFIASAFSGVSVREYADKFDTVYVSLYKYLGAAGGAILAGPASVMDGVEHQIKILGGTVYQTWVNTAMALHALDGIEERWGKVAAKTRELLQAVNSVKGLTLKAIENGTNGFLLTLDSGIDGKKLVEFLRNERQINLRPANDKGDIMLYVNESLLSWQAADIKKGLVEGIEKAKG